MENNYRNDIKTEISTNSKRQINNWSKLSSYIEQHQNPQYLENQNFKRDFHYFQHLEEQHDYKFFHLTVIYKRIDGKNAYLEACNQYFTSFYLKSFVPAILGTTHFNKDQYRPYQPITVAFTEKHQEKARKLRKQYGHKEYDLPNFYHHHAFVAIHPDTYNKAIEIAGLNRVPIKPSIFFVSSVFFEERPISNFQYITKKANLKEDDYLVFSGFHNRLPVHEDSTLASNSFISSSETWLN